MYFPSAPLGIAHVVQSWPGRGTPFGISAGGNPLANGTQGSHRSLHAKLTRKKYCYSLDAFHDSVESNKSLFKQPGRNLKVWLLLVTIHNLNHAMYIWIHKRPPSCFNWKGLILSRTSYNFQTRTKGIWGDSLAKPPFGVTSAEVAIIKKDITVFGTRTKARVFWICCHFSHFTIVASAWYHLHVAVVQVYSPQLYRNKPQHKGSDMI